jgi:hypothetical protein
MLRHMTEAARRGASRWAARAAFPLICIIWAQTAGFIALGTPDGLRPAALVGAVATLIWCFGTAPEGMLRRLAPPALAIAVLANAALWPGLRP